MRSKSKGRCWRRSEDTASDEGKRREKRETIAQRRRTRIRYGGPWFFLWFEFVHKMQFN
jgi:TnpA family transposase